MLKPTYHDRVRCPMGSVPWNRQEKFACCGPCLCLYRDLYPDPDSRNRCSFRPSFQRCFRCRIAWLAAGPSPASLRLRRDVAWLECCIQMDDPPNIIQFIHLMTNNQASLIKGFPILPILSYYGEKNNEICFKYGISLKINQK